MSIKSFLVALLLTFILYEIISVTIGVIKKKKEMKKIKESEENK